MAEPSAGERLKASVEATIAAASKAGEQEFELTEIEVELLGMAAGMADDLALLERSIGETGAMIEGSKGQLVANPAIAEARQARLAIARLLGELEIPDAEDAKPRSAASRRGRHAAQARWGHRGAA